MIVEPMIRQAIEADCQAIAEIYNYYIVHSVATFEENTLSPTEIHQRMLEKQQDGYSWLVAEADEGIIGYAYSGKWQARSAFRNSAEVTVYLHHNVLAKGSGTLLYDAVFAHLRQKGVHAVIAGITLPNPASIALHEKFGMQKVAHFNEVGYKFGQWLDVGYWQLLIK